MALFLVERNLPDIDAEGLAGAQRAAIAASERLSAEGRPLRYIRSTFIPGEDRCFCLFESSDAATVAEGNRAAGLPFERVMAAQDLPAPRP